MTAKIIDPKAPPAATAQSMDHLKPATLGDVNKVARVLVPTVQCVREHEAGLGHFAVKIAELEERVKALEGEE